MRQNRMKSDNRQKYKHARYRRKEILYPSWDAQNKASVHLAEKLGYEFSHEYVVYEVE